MTKEEAIAQVDNHVSRKNCFVTFDGKTWKPIEGTGCAHYVAHVLGIKKGAPGSTACLEGFAIRVPQLISGLATVAPADVQVDDIWANNGLDHCGIVTEVIPPAGKQKLIIEITHCSSRQRGVVTNEWSKHFGSGGRFYRSGLRSIGPLGWRRISYQMVSEAIG